MIVPLQLALGQHMADDFPGAAVSTEGRGFGGTCLSLESAHDAADNDPQEILEQPPGADLPPRFPRRQLGGDGDGDAFHLSAAVEGHCVILS